MRARTFKDAWDVDSGFIVGVPEGLIADFSTRLVYMLKTQSCNIVFTLALKLFSRLDLIFFPRMSWLEKKLDSGSVSQCGHR